MPEENEEYNIQGVSPDGKYVEDTPVPVKTPTQVAHPGKAILRTFVAAAVASVLAWVVRVVGIDLAEFEGALVDVITVSAWGLVLAAVQWALTHPTLMPFWRRIGLGTGVEKENAIKPQGTEQGL